jgi:conjugal transfer pilus assembly protein TraV
MRIFRKSISRVKNKYRRRACNKKGKESKDDKNNLLLREGNKPEEGNKTETESYTYRTELYKEISNLLKQPSTPFVVPPKVMRILILPYTTKDNTLEMSRYVYFFATPPKWVLSGEVNK